MFFKRKSKKEEAKKEWREEFADLILKQLEELEEGYSVTVELADGTKITLKRQEKNNSFYY